MFKPRLFLVAVLCLVLVSLLPSSSSALTLSELTGTVASSSYSPVTVTSATNKTITITATPQSFSNNQWTYQLAWNRAKNAKGSLYVSLKSSPSTKVATVATADQAGSVTFTALPSTAYRVEFYSQPNGKGSLLVRKYFMALAANAAAQASPAAGATSDVSNAGLPVDLNPNASTNVYSTNYLRNLPASQNPIAPYNVGSESHAGKTAWVAIMNYQGNDGKCYHLSADGTTSVIQCYANHPLPTLRNGKIPNPLDASYDWMSANAVCVWKDVGAVLETLCGGGSNVSAVGTTITPLATQYVNGLPMDTDPYSASNVYSSSYLYNLSASENPIAPYNVGASGHGGGTSWVAIMNYQGTDGKCYHLNANGSTNVIQCYANHPLPTLPNGKIPSVSNTSFNWSAANALCVWTDQRNGGPLNNIAVFCGGSDPSVNNGPTSPINPNAQVLPDTYNGLPMDKDPYSTSNVYSPSYINNLPDSENPIAPHNVGASLHSGGSAWVALMNYQGSDGKCYHLGANGVSSVIQCYTNHPLPTLANGKIPSVSNTSFNWSAANALCVWTDQRNGGPLNNIAVFCGGAGMDVRNGPASPIDPTAAPQATSYNGLPIDQDPNNVDSVYSPFYAQYGLPEYMNPFAKSDKSNVSVYANHPRAWVALLNYKGSDGKCYHLNPLGQTSTIQCYANHPLPTLVNGKIPSVSDSSFNWQAANGLCMTNEGFQIFCGGGDPDVNNGMAAPVNPLARTVSSSDTVFVLSMNYSSGNQCYHYDATTNNSSPMLCQNVNAMPPQLPNGGQWGAMPSGNDPSYNWANAGAVCYYVKSDGTRAEIACGTTAVPGGPVTTNSSSLQMPAASISATPQVGSATSVTLNYPAGSGGVFLSLSSSDSSVVSVPSTAFVPEGEVQAKSAVQCLRTGNATVTVSGYGLAAVQYTVSCR